MREASCYAEQFFPERGIQYIAIADNFDTEHDNTMAPFLFAMIEVCLRDGSRKGKDVLRSKRESGQYCACPPDGYRQDREDKHRLAPDEMTAPVVERIFRRAAAGDSSRKIALDRDTLPTFVERIEAGPQGVRGWQTARSRKHRPIPSIRPHCLQVHRRFERRTYAEFGRNNGDFRLRWRRNTKVPEF